jgi:hypothetical protein
MITTIIMIVPVHPQRGQSELECAIRAQTEGALAYDEFGTACWDVHGKVIPIGSGAVDVMKGFEITNFNFHVNGTQPALPTQRDLPGATDGVGGDGLLV